MTVLTAFAAALAITPPASAYPADPGTVKRSVSLPSQKTITLITGDRVIMQGDRHGMRITPGQGRKSVTFMREGTGDEESVIPMDAASLVAKGVLDIRLFQVRKLIKDGLDDDSSPTLPLILQHRQGDRAGLAAAVGRTRPLNSIDAVAAAPRKSDVSALWSRLAGDGPRSASLHGVRRIWLDGKVHATLDRSVAQVGAPEAWKSGLTGKGVKVAVLDTGIDRTHPDLAGRIDAEQDFTGHSDATDRHGHGTHVASTIAGQGLGGAPVRKGVAPGARLVIGKVLTDSGGGQESEIIAGMEWAAKSGAKVVNLSVGGPDSPGQDPMEEAVDHLTTTTRTLFVIAAGNSGPEPETVGSPGSATAALTVGAVDRHDRQADFSSRGPRIDDHAVKPELSAPGVGIAAARAAGARFGTPVGVRYSTMSGTSMATPHVAGAAAIVAQQHPGWSPAQIKAALIGSAKQVTGNEFQQGSGRLDVGRAVRQKVSVDVGTLAFGTVQYPYGQAPIVKKVTYRNGGGVPVSLELSARATTNDGQKAPAGMFTLSAAKLTVPAGGTATVTLTAHPKGGAAGPYGGRLTARDTNGRTVVHTLIGLDKEPRAVNARIRLIDRKGGVPYPGDYPYPVFFVPLSGTQTIRVAIAGGAGTARLPEGRYLAYAGVGTQTSGGGWDVSLAVLPDVNVTGRGEIVFDARTAKPVRVRTDRPDAKTVDEELMLQRDRPGGLPPITFYLKTQDGGRFPVTPTKGNTAGFRSRYWAVLAQRGDTDEGFDTSPYAYHLAFRTQGRIPEDYQVRDRDLGSVKADYAAMRSRLIVPMMVIPGFTGGWGPEGTAFEMPTRLPVSRTEYFTPRLSWFRGLNTFLTIEYGKPQTFTAGRHSAERWNTAVTGPALPEWAKLTRTGNEIVAQMPLWGSPIAGRTSRSVAATSRSTLLRDGKEIGSQDDLPDLDRPVRFTVPPGPGHYRLALEGTADPDAYELSSKVRAEWSFRSSATGGTKATPLPLLALRANPSLDLDNAAPAGRPMTLPLRLDRSGPAIAPVAKVTVEVSGDDGTTWQRVVALPAGRDAWTALTHPPGKPGDFVSLRLHAEDTTGNTVTQTITRAFRLR